MKVIQTNVLTRKRRVIAQGVCYEAAVSIQIKQLERLYKHDKADLFVVSVEND